MDAAARTGAIAAVQRALDDTEAEYAQMPLLVRLLVRRGLRAVRITDAETSRR